MGQEKDLMGATLERRQYRVPSQKGLRAWRSPSRGTVIEAFTSSPPSGGVFDEVDDWEEVAPPHSWDHAHCEFCWAKFEEAARVVEQPSPDSAIQTEGYVTADSKVNKWICERCFEDFKHEFRWSVVDSG